MTEQQNVTPTQAEINAALQKGLTQAQQDALRNARVAIVGLGGLGSNIAVALTRLGISQLYLYDFDRVELSNLNRQYYFLDDISQYKANALVKHEAKVSDGELVEGEEFDYEFFGTQTDAGVSDNTFAVKPGNDATKLENYEITYDRGALTVAPAPYSVTTESATKVYDGTALTAGGKIEGLLEGETANLKVTGSQTKVGASENTYTIEWTGTAKESNYKLESESIGTLTVTAAPDSPTPDDQSKDQGVFNGNGAGLVQTGDVTGIYGIAAIIAAAVAAFVSLLAVRRRKE